MKNGETHSTISNESIALQKLGFDHQGADNNRIFASILNRLRPSLAFIPIVIEIISYIQILSIGFYATIDSLLSGNSYTKIIHALLERSANLSGLFANEVTGHTALLIIFVCMMVIWVVFYFSFTITYKRSKSFRPTVINILYYLGYYGFFVFSVTISTTIGFFLRPLFIESDISAIPTFVSIASLFGYMFITLFMIRIAQSSPDVDIKNKLALWPQDYYPLVYRYSLNFVVPMILELLRGNGQIAEIIGYVISLIAGAIGIYFLWIHESNVFPQGRIVLTTEYVILITAPVLSIIYRFANINSLYFLLIFLVIVVGVGILLSHIMEKANRRKIDLLYLPFEELSEKIKSPTECIEFIKKGLVYNVPCINNHTLLNWSISRWPNHQPLLFMVSFTFYIIHMPYRDILDLVSVAVDIAPFNFYDGLLFYQIFNRLPTNEHQLMRRLEGIKRLYGLPQASLRNFWESVLAHHWDEAILKSQTFKSDLENLNQIFSHLIFENPSSECVMQEFIKFATKIQGNQALAYSAQRELNMRMAQNQDGQTQDAIGGGGGQDNESVAMSKLSSVKSSVFLSEFSENMQGADRAQNGIQEAVMARPIFWPNYFLICTLIVSTISFVAVVVTFVVTKMETKRLNNQLELAARIHDCAKSLTQILRTAMEFTTHSEDPENTVSGKKFDGFESRSTLNNLSNEFDNLLVQAFSLHTSLPDTFLELWVQTKIFSMILSPINGTMKQVSLMESIRIFQMKARTLAFSPDSYIGTIDDPAPEIMQITHLYSTVMEVASVLLLAITEVTQEEITGNLIYVIISIVVCIGVNLLFCIIFIPVIIFGTIREYDFFITLYSAIPVKIIKKILNHEETAREGEAVAEDHRGLRTKKSLPPRIYHIGQIIAVFIGVFIIPPIPVVIIALSYISHVNESQFVLHGYQLSAQMITNFGLLCLYSFRLVSPFPSSLDEAEEKSRFLNSATSMREKYAELFFGTDFFEKGLVSRKLASETSEICDQLQGYGVINFTCTSTHDDVYFLFGIAKRLLEIDDLSQVKGVSSPWWRLFYASAVDALDTGIDEFYRMFEGIANEQRSTNNSLTIISFIAGCILYIVAVVFCIIFTKQVLTGALKALLRPIMIMEPESIAESPFLLRFLQGDFDNSSHQTSRQSRTKSGDNESPLIDFILEGVLVMTADGTIIASNKKYHEMFQNTAEEVLGLNVINIFPSNLQPLFDALNHIKTGGVVQQNISTETMLFTDDDRELQVRVSLCARLEPNQHGNRTTVCAFIIADRSDLIKAQQQLRKEKANVEALLDSILPHNIAVSLLSGQSEISFEVDCACVLFSDIVSFTPMCSTMTAKQIMYTLNLLFTEFDTELAKFRRVTKLKTIGDAYVCAAGIFEGDGPLEEAASEIVTFGTRMQEIIPMLNSKHGTKVHMRIGIYTGGPLICGVLGKEKPLFEIIGQAVNLAEELEASSLHDKIHISQSTADLIQKLNMKLTERGDGIKIAGVEGTTWTVNC